MYKQDQYEQCKRLRLVRIYKGLYYPVKVGRDTKQRVSVECCFEILWDIEVKIHSMFMVFLIFSHCFQRQSYKFRSLQEPFQNLYSSLAAFAEILQQLFDLFFPILYGVFVYSK